MTPAEWTPIEWVAQIIGIIAMVEGFFIYFSRKRSNILIFKLINDVMNATMQLLLGAFTGAAINVVAIGRETVFYNRGKHKWASSIAWLFVFVGVIVGVSVLTWAGPISLVPMVGSAIAVVGFYSYKPIVTRGLGIIATGIWLVYQAVTVQIGAFIGNVIAIIAAIIGIIVDLKERKKAKTVAANSSLLPPGSPEPQPQSAGNVERQ